MMSIRIGVDIGGTKIEALALDPAGREILRKRVPSPRGDYDATISAVKRLVEEIDFSSGAKGSVGLGIPGALSRATWRVKNSNSTWLIGRSLKEDLERALKRGNQAGERRQLLRALRGGRRGRAGRAGGVRRDPRHRCRRRHRGRRPRAHRAERDRGGMGTQPAAAAD